MSMTSVFCDVDDFCLVFEPEWHKRLICNTKKPLVISKPSLSEIMTIIICFHQSAFRDFKHYYQNLIEDLTDWLYGDKGYISEKLVAWLKEKGLNLVTKVRKNMKPKELKAFDKAMLRKRAVIESVQRST